MSEAAPDREALLRQAQHLRTTDRVDEALTVLSRLERRFPNFSRLHQERGHCLVLMREGDAALASLAEAVRLNPALPASWDMLEQLHRMTGNRPGTQMAARQLALLRQLPRRIVIASSLMADGDLAPAEQALRDHLREDAGNIGALHMLARIRLQCGAVEDAQSLLATVVAQAPDFAAARFDHAMALLDLGRHCEARAQAQVLLRHDPASRPYRKLLGAACIGLGDHEAVIDLYRDLLDEIPATGPEAADLRLWRGNALKVAGRTPEAIADFRASLATRPGNAAVWCSLANLKTFRFGDADIAAMQAAAEQPGLHEQDRIYLAFALGAALEQRQDHAGSWQHYARANALKRGTLDYDPQHTTTCAAQVRTLLTAEFFERRKSWGIADAQPIFIVGLPRSGSTLVEQILASHSQVEGTQELTVIGRMSAELCGAEPASGLPLNPGAIADLGARDVRRLAERFLEETRAYRRTDAPRFIDKMPNNFWHIGLIHLMFPSAAVIDVRRAPMACCFSNFKQLFGTDNQPFTYAMEDLAAYYRDYLNVMAHWDAVLPGRILRLRYEDLVDDLAGGVQRLLDHAALPMERACLHFHETRRSIRTPSSEQVRQPINRDGLAQWRPYASWLAPLETALGDALTRYEG